MEKKLRKYSDNLRISGYAMVAFGLWTMIKTIISFAAPNEYMRTILQVGDEVVPIGFVAVATMLILGLEFMLRIFVAKRAIRQSKGYDTKPGYLVLAMIFAVGSLCTIFYFVPQDFRENGFYIEETVSNVIVEVTSFLCYVDLIFSAVMVRKIRKYEKERK